MNNDESAARKVRATDAVMNRSRILINLLLCLIPMVPFVPGVLVLLASEKAMIHVSSISIEEFTPRRSQWPIQRVTIHRTDGVRPSTCKLFFFEGNDIDKRAAASMEILQKRPPFQVSGRVSSLGSDHCWIYTDHEAIRGPLLFCFLIFAAVWRFSPAWMKPRPGAAR